MHNRIDVPVGVVTPDDLVEIEAIKRVKHRYLRLIDTKRWDELAPLFVPDATSSSRSTASGSSSTSVTSGFSRRCSHDRQTSP